MLTWYKNIGLIETFITESTYMIDFRTNDKEVKATPTEGPSRSVFYHRPGEEL